jgi:hypothetical protein
VRCDDRAHPGAAGRHGRHAPAAARLLRHVPAHRRRPAGWPDPGLPGGGVAVRRARAGDRRRRSQRRPGLRGARRPRRPGGGRHRAGRRLATRAPGRVQLGLPRLARGAGPDVGGGAVDLRRGLRPGRRPLRQRRAASAALPGRPVRADAVGLPAVRLPRAVRPGRAPRRPARAGSGDPRRGAGLPRHVLGGRAVRRAARPAHGVDTEIHHTGCAWGTTPGSDQMLVCRKEPT